MKLRTGILLGITLLVVAIIASTVVAVVIVLDRSERHELRQDLARSRQVFEDLIGYRSSVLRSDCRVVANEPRLRAVVATQDISRETIVGVITELRTSLGSDLFVLTDGSGELIADALQPDAEGNDLTTMPVIASAIATREGTGVWITDGKLHQVQACRIDFGTQAVGIIVVGRVFDDATARAVERQSGSTLVVTIDGKTVATSTPGASAVVAGAALAEVDLDGTRYVAVGGSFPGYDGARATGYAMLRSLDEALAPVQRLTYSIFGIAGLALVAALLLALALARRLSRPVDDLVKFTHQIAGGALATRANPSGATEVRALASAMNTMVSEIEKGRGDLVKKERLEREMEIAMRIQTSMLPRNFEVIGMDIAARMIPATEVGGDYYDILPVESGCWIGIGDVAGHGLTAGLEMLMVQSVIAALVRADPGAMPRDHVRVLNHVVFENIRNRLGQDEHITLTLLRLDGDGKVTFAGAHEEILVSRAAGGDCERIPTPGTWLAAIRDVSRFTEDSTIELGSGDVMVLYSDGVSEAPATDGTLFGMDRLCRVIEDSRGETAEVIRDRIVAAVETWQSRQDDDISVLVLKRA